MRATDTKDTEPFVIYSIKWKNIMTLFFHTHDSDGMITTYKQIMPLMVSSKSFIVLFFILSAFFYHFLVLFFYLFIVRWDCLSHTHDYILLRHFTTSNHALPTPHYYDYLNNAYHPDTHTYIHKSFCIFISSYRQRRYHCHLMSPHRE